MAPLEDLFDEAQRTVTAADRDGVSLRATGGVGIGLVSPSARQPPLSRQYGDIDFVGLSKETAKIEALFSELGYEAESEFNDIHGERRLFFVDREHGREADVFLNEINACHQLPLKDRLEVTGPSLATADLLLSKLQVVETNEKDFKDTLALIADHPLSESEDGTGIDMSRVTDICGSDWGWWKTVTMVAARARDLAGTLAAKDAVPGHTPERIDELLERLEAAPKSRRWKMRARVGERVRWHESPEELSHTT